MAENDRPVVHETTVINTGRRGGGGAIAMLALLVVVIVALAVYFGGFLHRVEKADKVDVSVNVALPKMQLPDIRIDPNRNQATASNQSGGK